MAKDVFDDMTPEEVQETVKHYSDDLLKRNKELYNSIALNDTPRVVRNMYDLITAVHKELEKAYHMERGILDDGMLKSAIATPFQTAFGQELFPTVEEKAARLCYGLTKNHCFRDGNKRTAVHSMLVYMNANGKDLEYSLKEMENMVMDVTLDKKTVVDLSKWVQDHAVQYDKNRYSEKNNYKLR